MVKLNLYNQLLIRKINGEKLDFDKITYDELYQLSGKEDKADSLIADLFDIPQSRVKKKRSNMGLSQMMMTIKKDLDE